MKKPFSIWAASLLITLSLTACTSDEGENTSTNTPNNYKRQITVSDLVYQGGFRLSSNSFGDTKHASLSYSPGTIALNKENNSFYVTSHDYEQGIAEFEIPDIVNSRDIAEFNVGDNVLQNFALFHDTDRVETGIDNYFRITGMEKIGSKLIVNYFNWYDASGQETDTTVVFNNPNNLAGSDIYGSFQMDGAAHAGGWLTPIPAYYHEALGGTYISGWSGSSIISRMSVGPSAFVQTPEDNLLASTEGGVVKTTAVLDFDLANMLYDKANNPNGYDDPNPLLDNNALNNDLWTINSSAKYGFIIPDSDTYITLGSSAGHKGGLGYKITQDNGNLCGGSCPKMADDHYNYYWMWSVKDLIKVKNSELAPHELRPYEYGKLDLPTTASISGGAFDYETGLLYLSLTGGDAKGVYNYAPIFFVYKINSITPSE